ncbi:MAG: site-specific integrase [Firmicutes bacterium]|nr:site-specific integrase [Bacillota bacterium]
MAKLFKRKDGRWSAQVFVGIVDGKRKYRTVYGETQAEVRQKTSLISAQVQRRTYIEPSNVTAEMYLTDWVETLDSVRANTRESYDMVVRNYLTPYLGQVKLQELGALDIRKMLAALERQGLAPRTREYAYSVLNAALNDAVLWDAISINPCTKIKRPHVPDHEITPLTEGESKKLLETALELKEPFYALYVLALTTGMRASELLGLQWRDIDFANSRLAVRRVLVKDSLEFSEPKTKLARRSITLTDLAVNALKKHAEEQAKIGNTKSNWSNTSGLVFCDSLGGPMRYQNLIRRHFKPLLMKAELRDIRFHDLRHTCASLLLQAGEHPKIVQELLGHSKISITMDLYSHSIPSMQKETARKMDSIFQEKRSLYLVNSQKSSQGIRQNKTTFQIKNMSKNMSKRPAN